MKVIHDLVDIFLEIMCIITSFLEHSQQPVANNIYNAYIPYPLNTAANGVVLKKMKK